MATIDIFRMPNDTLPLAKATRHNGVVYLSGQIGFAPGTTTPIEGGVVPQAEQVFANIDAILAEAGSTRDQILKVTIYLTDIKRDYAAMNEAYKAWIGDHRPARTTLEAPLAMDGLVIEIDVIAACD